MDHQRHTFLPHRRVGLFASIPTGLLSSLPLLVLLGTVTPVSVLLAAEEDYLKQLEAEADKIDVPREDAGQDAAAQPSTTDSDRSREYFERELEKRYHGSYVFYQKLPERSREEIFAEYQQGASIVTLRKKIIDRFLQR